MHRKIFYLIISFFTIIGFLSCTDSTPVILSVNSTIIYDYETETSVPSVRLSVFIQPDTEPQRFSEIEIRNVETDFVWRITEPQFISANGKNYIGCPYLLPYNNGEIPFGEYIVKYTDLASHDAIAKFFISKPVSFQDASIYKSTYADVNSKKTARDFIFDRVILEDENGNVIYYGGQKKETNKISEVRKYYPDARIMRNFRMTSNKLTGILLAPIVLPEYIEKIQTITDAEEE